jgi:hypothetical protein
MVKRFFFIISLLAVLGSSAQTFAPIGAKWYYSAYYGTNPDYTLLYQSIKDTAIDLQYCREITVTRYNSQNTFSETPVFAFQSNDTVYYYNAIYQRFLPLYIYDVAAGDTIVYHAPDIPAVASDTTWKSIVDSVTYIIAGSDTLKYIHTHEPDVNTYSFWGGYAEKLGGTFLMLHQPHYIIPETDGSLLCYVDSTMTFSFYTNGCNLSPPSGLHTRKNELQFSAAPNPANGFINISTNFSGECFMSIYNFAGDLLLNTTACKTCQISLQDFSNGIYFMKMASGNEVRTLKFIVSR